MICCFGVCIPLNALLPLVLFLFKPLYEYFQRWRGVPVQNEKLKASPPPSCSTLADDKIAEPAVERKWMDLKDEENFMIITESSTPSFSELKETANGLVVKFTATWCKPCKRIEPHFKALSKDYSSVIFATVDVDECAEIAADHGVVGLPAFHFYKCGQLLGKVTGDNEKSLTELVQLHSQQSVPATTHETHHTHGKHCCH
jgi:thioredoxin 1